MQRHHANRTGRKGEIDDAGQTRKHVLTIEARDAIANVRFFVEIHRTGIAIASQREKCRDVAHASHQLRVAFAVTHGSADAANPGCAGATSTFAP